MKNVVNGLLQEYIKKNKTGDIAQMTIGDLTIFIAGFIKSFQEDVERVISKMTVSDLTSIQRGSQQEKADACNQTPTKPKNDRQAVLERAAHARQCRLEQIAQRKAVLERAAHARQCRLEQIAQRKAEALKNGTIVPIKLYKRRPHVINTDTYWTYAVYERCDGQNTNVMYAHVPVNVDRRGVNVLKRSYATQTGTDYMKVSCRRI